MGLIEKTRLISMIAPPFDSFLASQLLDEFVSIERRFIQGDWEPTQLDGGQFCEILSRILYHQDSGNLSLNRDFSECVKYITDDKLDHKIHPRSDALHLAKVLQTVYKLRNQRGSAHISPNYKPNHMDSKLIVECVRWCMNDTLRIFWSGDREEVAKAIRELLQFDVPCVGKYEDIILVQRTDMTAEEEVLVLLHYAGEQGFSRAELSEHAQISSQAITNSLNKLTSPSCRQVVQLSNGKYRLTDLGTKRIREQLVDKLLLQ